MTWSSLLITGNKLLLLVVVASLSLGHCAGAGLSLPDCQRKCGDISIPYPFGINGACSREDAFSVICDEEEQVLYLGKNKSLRVLEINVHQGEVRVENRISSSCHNHTDNPNFSEVHQPIFRFDNPYFVVSSTKNKLTAIGCATVAILYGQNENQLSGCASFCDKHGIDNSAQCTGMGCCHASIPDNLKYLDTLFAAVNHINYSHVWEYSPCSYAFIAEQNMFNFSASYAKATNFREMYGANHTGVPMVLDWAIGTGTCNNYSMINHTSYACVDRNSECIDAPNGLGYSCVCSQGYAGNPYIVDGCTDINECASPDLYCQGTCINTFGSYECSCRPGTQSKDPKSTPCTPIPGANQKTEVMFVIGISICSICIIICISIVIMKECKKRQVVKEKERHFKENGGPILFQQIHSRQIDTVILFTVEDLDKATKIFDKSTELGTGGHGTVYKGNLTDEKVVAVKRSKIINMAQAEEFIQEIIILSQINHRNVVRLLGCCLEVEVPMLVYEFVPNGTLFHLLYSSYNDRPPVPLEVRLRIAQESADALVYLHLSTDHPIVHGDVKSLNILLDENYTAKVTDFGASRMLPKDADQHMTIVQGTPGYLDPEYHKERHLTEKSDVYSFGVVLLELITGKMAIYSDGHKERISLASTFMLAMKENRVGDLLDTSIMGVGTEELLQEVAELGIWCLSDKGEERPSMIQVANKLKAIRSSWRKLLLLLKHNETELLIKRSADVASAEPSPTMYCTAPMLGMDIETPYVVDHAC
ncbi:wall-associated receptor kinase 5-like isoform X2 [Miscanthus floridulus]|uniref:wall-associated receptor kinase 5-like isoform X2 n=1 Tax=Miscanthus floridulus TaxID=154761 RepID=UPI003459A8A0